MHAGALSSPFDYRYNYPSLRAPLFARNVVTTSHPLAAQAGLSMLARGGNAVDAAIAAAAAMTIVEPCSNGLGSDAFAIVWDGQRLHGLNASGRAPQAWTPDYFFTKYGSQARTPPPRGWDAVTVPGAVSAWLALSERFGRLGLAELLQPAIELADRGHVVGVNVAAKWALSAQLTDLTSQPGFAQTFLPDDRAPLPGELFCLPGAARALRAIAATRGDAFYRGEIAEAIVRQSRAQGGALELADLAACRPEWVDTLSLPYRHGAVLHELPPNGQGLAALMAVGIARHFDLASLPVDGAACQHLQIEAMKLAFADTYRYLAERSCMEVEVEQLLAPAYLAGRARLIDPGRAQDFGPGDPAKGGTIYLAAADASGMMVSFIQSNYMGFGSGVVVPQYGVSLHNRGHAFCLDAGHCNVVAPGKRPFHTIIPAFLTDAQGARMAFGVMGASMQPQGQLQTLVRMIDHQQTPQAACDAPRWRVTSGLSVNVEPAMDPLTAQGLAALGHRITVVGAGTDPDFGAGQFIWCLGDAAVQGYLAASDARRDGQAVGF